MKESRRGLWMVIISGLVFGIMPGAVTFCYGQGATSVQAILLRFGILSILLAPGVLRQKKTKEILRRHWKQFIVLCLTGTGTPILLFTAYRYLPTGMATTLHFLYPTVVALLCLIVFKEKLSGIKALCFALCLGGILLMLQTGGAPVSTFGVIVVLLSSLTWGLYIVFMDKFDLSDLDAKQIMFFEGIGNVAMIAVYGALTGDLFAAVTPLGWGALALASTVIAVFGSLFFAAGVRHTDAQASAIASTLEPITSIFVGVLFLKEPLTVRTAIASVLILSAVVLLTLFGEKKGENT